MMDLCSEKNWLIIHVTYYGLIIHVTYYGLIMDLLYMLLIMDSNRENFPFLF